MSRLMSSLAKQLPAIVVLSVIALAVIAAAMMGIQPIRISGGSMEPTLPNGSIIIVKPIDELAERDIITFREPGSSQLTTHTFIGHGEDGSLMTKGDANPTPDVFAQPLQSADVVGKVVLMSPLFSPSFWFSIRGLTAMVGLIGLAWLFIWPSRTDQPTQAEEGDQDEHNLEETHSSPHPA